MLKTIRDIDGNIKELEFKINPQTLKNPETKEIKESEKINIEQLKWEDCIEKR